MAKLRFEGRERRPLRYDPRVRAKSDAFARAIRLGYSSAEAAQLVNEGREIVPKPKAGAAQPQPVSMVSVSGRAEAAPPPEPEPAVEETVASQIDAEDIPPNWQDLPWANLRELAANVSGRNIRSKAEAEAAITEFLQQRDA